MGGGREGGVMDPEAIGNSSCWSCCKSCRESRLRPLGFGLIATKCENGANVVCGLSRVTMVILALVPMGLGTPLGRLIGESSVRMPPAAAATFAARGGAGELMQDVILMT